MPFIGKCDPLSPAHPAPLSIVDALSPPVRICRRFHSLVRPACPLPVLEYLSVMAKHSRGKGQARISPFFSPLRVVILSISLHLLQRYNKTLIRMDMRLFTP
jgi:hypothetical protein